MDLNCTKIIINFAIKNLIVIVFLFLTLRSKATLGNAHENSEELERARDLKEKEAAL